MIGDGSRISAGELRAIGLNIPAEIPDCSWVPRKSIIFSCRQINIVGDQLSAGLSATFTVPFAWVEVGFMVSPKP